MLPDHSGIAAAFGRVRTTLSTSSDAGVPEHVMQRRLGHADSRTTREVYTHVLPDSERKAAEIMEAILGQPGLV